MDNLLRDPIRTETANFTVSLRVPFYFIDASNNDIDIMLMSPSVMVSSNAKQARVQFKRIDTTSHVVTIKAPSGRIEDNGPTYDLAPLQSVTMFSDRVNYYVQRGRGIRYQDLVGLPDLFDGDYNSLNNLPNLFSGNYSDLFNAPQNISFFNNDSGYLTSASLSGYEPKITAGTVGQYWRGDKTWQNLNSSAVGLGNVDNTSDANKPVSTAAASALAGKFPNPTGTTSQYLRGDGSLAVFPTNLSSFTNGPGYITNVVTALGYTPYNATNPAGYISSITGANVTTALGYTPYNGTTNSNSYISNITGLVTAGTNVTITGSGTSGSPYVVSSQQMGGASSSNAGSMSAADKIKLDSIPAGPPNQLIGTVTVGETALVALTAGVRKVTVTAPGTVVGGNYLLFPTAATPAGYALGLDVVCVVAGQLQVSITAPLLALGANYSIPCRLIKINSI